MTQVASIVCWQPLFTDHQSHTLRALQRAMGASLTVMVARSEDANRKAQGWTSTATEGIPIRMLGPGTKISEIRRVLAEHKHSIHLFGSPFDHPRFMLALWMALRKGLPTYLISEPYSPISNGYLSDKKRGLTWLKSKLRPWAYRFYGLLLRKRVRGVFAISQLAVRQYRALGIPSDRIHPFGYFVPVLPSSVPDQPLPKGPVPCRAVFVGNLLAIKGLSELLAAAKHLQLEGLNLEIDVYGAGNPKAFDFDIPSVRYAGRIPFGSAPSVIAGYDFLVLTSRYDGWGVVINESIQAGVPVVCSDRVGAGSFVKPHACGIVYDATSIEALIDALRKMTLDVTLRTTMRACARASSHLLDPEVAGQYMAEVIAATEHNAAPPRNPWYTC